METLKLYFSFLCLLLSATAFSQVQIDHQIEMTGMGTNASITGIKSVVNNQDAPNVDAIQKGSLVYALATGSNNSFVLNISPAISAYQAGMVFNFIASQSVTGPATLTVNSLSAIPITRNINAALNACDIESGQAVSVLYDGANFQMISALVNIIAGVSITANPSGAVCSGTSITFTATPANGGSAPSYQWQVNGGNVGSGGTTYTTTSLNSGDAVTCIMTSNASCVTQNPATSNTITMTINSSPASVSIAANPSGQICAGTSVTFTATPTSGGSSPTYQWKVNGSNVGSGGTTYSSSSFNNGDIVSCVMTSNATCATQNPATSNSVTMGVGLHIGNSYEGGIIFYVDGSGCHGLVYATADQAGGSVTWYNGSYVTTGATGNTLYSGQTNTTTIISVQGAGTYAATIATAYNGGGYTDWYLGSAYELGLLNAQQPTLGALPNGYYWTSTETGNTTADIFNLNLGNTISADKSGGSTRYVRAIRRF